MVDVIIIGGGVCGASVAYALSRYELKVLLAEKDNDVANGTSKANSAIIHAGYDPEENTLMARLNVRGSELCQDLCEKLDVSYQRCGALVLAFSEEDNETVRKLKARGEANGVRGLSILSKKEVLEMEPQLSEKVTSALYAPTSAIVNPWELTIALAETAVVNGVEVSLNSEVTAIEKKDGIFRVHFGDRVEECRYVINCAGLYADKINDMVNAHFFDINSVKGEYYLLDKSEGTRVSHTIFQCPNRNGKGVLVSPTVHGNLIVGPNTENNEKEDLATTAEGLAFVKKQAAVSVPSIDFRENVRNFAGNRAKTAFTSDFILGERETEGFYNVAAICSPGLSSAPAIAEEVVSWLLEKEKLTEKKEFTDSRKVVRFKELSMEEKNELIRKRPEYGRIVCRCEEISEGEILDALHSPIPPVSVDGIKRRTKAGLGRCQGSFCGPRVTKILADFYHTDETHILQNGKGSYVAVAAIKEDLTDEL